MFSRRTLPLARPRGVRGLALKRASTSLFITPQEAVGGSFRFLQPLNARKEKGIDVLHDPLWNKGAGFSKEERERLGIRGLLPYQVTAGGRRTDRLRTPPSVRLT